MSRKYKSKGGTDRRAALIASVARAHKKAFERWLDRIAIEEALLEAAAINQEYRKFLEIKMDLFRPPGERADPAATRLTEHLDGI